MNKKGISPLIATVIIIGFTIVLAALVINYGSELLEKGKINDNILDCAKIGGIWYDNNCYPYEEIEKLLCPQKTFCPEGSIRIETNSSDKPFNFPKGNITITTIPNQNYDFIIYEKGIDNSTGICWITTKIKNEDNIQHRYKITNSILIPNLKIEGREELEFELEPKITEFKRSEFIDCQPNYKELLNAEVEVIR